MKSIKISCLIIVALCSAMLVLAKDWPSAHAKIDFRVVDDQGLPVYGAQVSGYFLSPQTHDAVGDKFNLTTDTNGVCVVKGKGYDTICGRVKGDNHYQTEFNISLGDRTYMQEKGEWPVKNATVILKAIRNPIPMFAKHVDIEIPEQGKQIGFDLEKGDWITPYGCGTVADLYFSYSLETSDIWTGTETFEIINTNKMCGVQELDGDKYSGFVSNYEAPVDGYSHYWHDILNRTKTEIIENKQLDGNSYIIFRSRARIDKDGNLIHANYGKVYPPIRHGCIDGKCQLRFTYYLNPTPNDRNLEFDPSKNLFGTPRRGRQVYHP